MKKQIPALLVTCLLSVVMYTNVIAQKKAPAKSLKVWLLDGVPLKSSLADNGKTIATIPYGIELTPMRLTGEPKAFFVDFNTAASKKPYQLSGIWMKVTYKGKEGYVFGGYLSAMPILEIDSHGFTETEDAYLKRNYGVLKITKKTPKKGSKETSIYYKNGAVTTETSSDGCFDHKLLLKDVSLDEGILFQKVLYKNSDAAQNLKVEQQKAGGVKISSYDCD
jgi:hypothetical protein